MKKVELATGGVVAACVACCAFPLALPMVGALSVAGFVSLGLDAIHMGTAATVVVLVAAAGSLAWAAARFQKRRHAQCATSPKLDSCAVRGNDGNASCACSKGTS